MMHDVDGVWKIIERFSFILAHCFLLWIVPVMRLQQKFSKGGKKTDSLNYWGCRGRWRVVNHDTIVRAWIRAISLYGTLRECLGIEGPAKQTRIHGLPPCASIEPALNFELHG
jgi:hypothetical protein